MKRTRGLTRYEHNYNRLIKILGPVNTWPKYDAEVAAVKLTTPNDAFMPFCVDCLGPDDGGREGVRYALSHYYKHSSGDMVPDPDMEVLVRHHNRTVEALTFQDIQRYDEVYPEPGKYRPALKKSLNAFLQTWLLNIIQQGHQRPESSQEHNNNMSKKPYEEKASKLFTLLLPHRDTDVMQRLQAHMAAVSGCKFTEYLNTDASDDDKEALIDSLIEIAEAQDWERFEGAVPAGQVVQFDKPPPPAPAVNGTAAAAATGRVNAADLVGDEKAKSPAARAAANGRPVPIAAEEATKSVNPEGEPAERLLEALDDYLARSHPSAITEERVRCIVREEVAAAMSKLTVRIGT